MPTSATRPEKGRRRARAPSLSLAVQYAVARTGLPSAASLKRWASAALERDVAATLRFVGLAEGRILLKDEKGRAQMGAAARARLEERFTYVGFRSALSAHLEARHA